MDARKAISKHGLARRLQEARERTRWLLRTVSDEDLARQHDEIMSPQRDALSDESYAGLLGTTDSETIFAELLDRLREDPADLTRATGETVQHVTRVCGRLGVGATLNLAVTDGTEMAFTRYSTDGPGNSLYFVEEARAFPDAIVVASERLDGDGRWREVPDRHLLTVGEGGASVIPLR